MSINVCNIRLKLLSQDSFVHSLLQVLCRCNVPGVLLLPGGNFFPFLKSLALQSSLELVEDVILLLFDVLSLPLVVLPSVERIPVDSCHQLLELLGTMPLLTGPHRLGLFLFSLSSQDGFVLHSFALHLHSHHHLFLLSHGSLDILFLPVQEVGGYVGSVHPKDSIL
jgi:hypothetical protein